jgi:hypothetical protein
MSSGDDVPCLISFQAACHAAMLESVDWAKIGGKSAEARWATSAPKRVSPTSHGARRTKASRNPVEHALLVQVSDGVTSGVVRVVASFRLVLSNGPQMGSNVRREVVDRPSVPPE